MPQGTLRHPAVEAGTLSRMKPPAMQTLTDLARSFSERGDTPAIHAFTAGGAELISYRTLFERIERVAGALALRGLEPGDRVLLCAPNSPDWVAAYFGIISAGAIAVPVDDQATSDMLAGVARHSELRFGFTSSKHVEELSSTAHPLRDYHLLDANGAASALDELDAGASAALPPIAPEQIASLLYTSGTTGTPKAVPLTHRNLAADASALIEEALIGPADRVLMPLPLHHTYPFTVGMLMVLGLGARIIMPSGVTGPEITGAAKTAEATAMLGVPSLYEAVWQSIDAKVKAAGQRKERLFRRLLSLSGRSRRLTGLRTGRLLFRSVHSAVGPSLGILGCGGAKLDPRLAENLEALGWTVLTGYGLTETSPVLTFNSRRKRRLTSEGRPISGVEIRIDRKPGEPHGEILARGPNVFAGYWQNEGATRDAFTPDGWFRTGDLGYVDDDGFLHIVGRSKEVIVLADGKNIFPEEVEPCYATPLLREIGIFERGGALVALVVPDEDEVRRRGGLGVLRLLKEELERLASSLPPYQRIIDFRAVREPLPRTRLGKIKRHELPQLFEKADKRSLEDVPVELSAADRALIEATETTKGVWAWLEERYPDRALNPDMSPQLDLQIDSLGWVAMTLELEQRFAVTLSATAVSRVLTLRDLMAEVKLAEEQGPAAPAAAPRTVTAQRQGPLMRAFGSATYMLNRRMIRLFYRLDVQGADAIPDDHCVAITPNHVSYLDPPAIAAALPRRVLRNVHWAGWVGVMYAGWFSSFVSRATRVFPVDPDQDLTGAIGTARALLDRGASVVWFPEGRRSLTGELQSLRPGAGVLLKGSRCLVVPAYVAGTFEAWPPQRPRPRAGQALRVVFGEPVSVETLIAEGSGDTDEMRIVSALERRIAALSPGGGSGRSSDDEEHHDHRRERA
jgi:long-chain acyl-CoA synthetase